VLDEIEAELIKGGPQEKPIEIHSWSLGTPAASS
jgi:hypothetical protein